MYINRHRYHNSQFSSKNIHKSLIQNLPELSPPRFFNENIKSAMLVYPLQY